ncbi:MAG TPA: hypothetical protein VIZ68_02170, partial [Thermoplasmata archaeon]
TVLLPFHISNLVRIFTGSTAAISNGQTVALIGGACVAVLAAFVGLRVFRRSWLTTSWIVVTAGVLAVLLEALAGYALSIATDYRRFQYFLFAPLVGAALLALEAVLEGIEELWSASSSADPVEATEPRRAPPPSRIGRPSGRSSEAVLVVVTVVVLLGAANYYTLPAGENYEAYFARYAHDQGFVDLVNSITDSGVDGNLITTTPFSGHWPSALTSRVTYVPSPIGTVNSQFSAVQIQNGELTELTLGERYVTTNALVGAGIPGIAPGDFNSSPDIGAFVYSYYQDVLRLPPWAFQVGLSNGSTFTPFPVGLAAPPVSPINGGYGYQISSTVQGVTFVENVSTSPGLPTVEIHLTVYSSNASTNPTFLQARVAAIGGVSTTLEPSATPGEFFWNTTTKAAALSTIGEVTPTGGLDKVTPYNSTTGSTATVVVRQNATDPTIGDPILTLQLNVTTPAAFNVLTTLGPWVQADQTWSSWGIRFALQYNGSTSLALVTPEFLQEEYGAAEFGQSGQWAVFILPEWSSIAPVGGALPLSGLR